jgi:hypothetical protein
VINQFARFLKKLSLADIDEKKDYFHRSKAKT